MKEHAMKTFLGVLVLCLGLVFAAQPVRGQGGGTITFGNNTSSLVNNGVATRPVTLEDGIQAALYGGNDSTNLSLIGAPVMVGIPVNGIFAGGTRTAPDIAGNTSAWFQVRAWSGGFATYEQAAQYPGVLLGQSAVIRVTTGDEAGAPPTPPGPLAGLATFSLMPFTKADSTVSLICAGNKTVQCGSDWGFEPPAVVDTCGDSNVTLVPFPPVTNGHCPQVITETWLASDNCGSSNVCSQVAVVVDTLPPVLVCISNKNVECGNAWSFDSPAVSDACSGAAVVVREFGTVTNYHGPCWLGFDATRNWQATDACGNISQCSQTVHLVDSTPPTLVCAGAKAVQWGTAWLFDPPTAPDLCSGTNVVVTVADTVTNGQCPQVVTRTWTATDQCGNSAKCSQAVSLVRSNCQVLVVTRSCPPYPVPPGGLLAFAGSITNAGIIPLTNVLVMADQPAPNTLVFGPTMLEPGEGASFAGSYRVGACACGPFSSTVLASGIGLDGILYSNSVTATCAGTNYAITGDLNGDGIVDQNELNAVLANYWATSPWVYMTNATSMGHGLFQFALTNASGWNFTVLVTTNLVDWSSLPGPAWPVYQFLDPDAANDAPARFYRLRFP
jgi:hypothetical protein